MTMISSATPLREARARARLASSLRVMMQAEMRFIACCVAVAAGRSISWPRESHPGWGSSAQGRVGDLLTDKFSDQLGLGWTLEVTRGEKRGKFSIAIEEKPFFISMTLEMDLHDRRVVPFAFLSSTPSAVKMWAVVLAPGKVSRGRG